MKNPNNSEHNNPANIPAGLDVVAMTPPEGGRITIDERDEYSYYCYFLNPGQRVVVENLGCATVFLPIAHNTLKEITVNNQAVQAGASALAELCTLEITATVGRGYVLVSGSKKEAPNATTPKLTIRTASEHYVVKKPWGHELWINGEHPVLSFKEVFIKQGYQTSLQYHNFKMESALLYSGVCDIVYKSNTQVSNDNVQPGDLAVFQLGVMGKICVEPKTLHRMRAATDIYHYEVSTPHLDDVVRVQDDKNRGHGRIKDEHLKS